MFLLMENQYRYPKECKINSQSVLLKKQLLCQQRRINKKFQISFQVVWQHHLALEES